MFQFMQLPSEIRLLVYDYSHAIREPPFHYQPRESCQHNNLQTRDVIASGDLGEHSCNRVQDISFDGCSRRVRQGQTGFLGLRLTSRQIYIETYHLIKLPPITLREFRLQINEISISSFIHQVDRPWIRDHTKEVSISWWPICKHLPEQQQIRERSCYSTFLAVVKSILQIFYDADGTARRAAAAGLCVADQGAMIRPLVELLMTFPRLELLRINTVTMCRIPYSMAVIGHPDVLAALRNRGVDVRLV